MQQIPIMFRNEIDSINFPPAPHVLLRFLTVVEDDRASVAELATLVGLDPALSARFLTVANSPALRRDKEIISLEQCMVTLGTRLARTLAACLAIQSVFARTAGEVQYDFRGFWKHSLRMAEMARAIAAKINYDAIEEAFLAGLLHDVGLLLLLGSVGDRYGDLLQKSIDEAVLSDIEKPMIGTDHPAVGAWLVDQWKLSSFMSDAILFHHKSLIEITDADTLSKIVWSAHIISTFNDNLDLASVAHTPDFAAVTSMLGIDVDAVKVIRDQSVEHVAAIAEALGIAESDHAGMLPVPAIPFEACRARLNYNDPIHSQLDEIVRDMALMQSLQHDLTSMCGEEDIYIAIKESAKILFGLGRLAFLIVNPETGILSGANFMGQSPLLKRLEIRLDSGSSLAAAVVAGDRPHATLDNDRPAAVSLVDVQIAHILDTEGVLYVPMRIRERRIGVMAYGISVLQHSRIQKRLAWMTNFANLAAISINAWQETRNSEEQIEASVTSRFEMQARRVVHEAGNPLAIIKNYLKIVAQKIPGEANILQEFGILREEIDRVSTILQRLNSLSATTPANGTVDVNGIIEGMLSLYGSSLFSSCGIAIDKNLDPALPPVSGDRDSIKQILLNIWKNAAEALSVGGRVTIGTKGPVTKNRRDFIEITLGDSGPGLPPDVRQRLFQPLEHNRRPGHSGLGLSIVATLVEQLEGAISCQSDAGQGTTFTIQLPCSNRKE